MKFFIKILLISGFILTACARIGSPSGGDKDTTPPKILYTNPENQSINFKGNEITIAFDEFILLKDLQKNLLITPPINPQPKISPTGFADKKITIKFEKPLQENTTYLINFGQSIQDNNEGNKYGNYQFVFSTGNTIDSLKLKGKVIPVHFEKNPENIMVGLYDLENYKDSLVFREPPRYVVFPDKKGNFNFNFLKKGKYKAIAIADENHNYVYNPDKEAIGFVPGIVEIPKDTLIEIKLFKALGKFKIEDIKQVSKNMIQIQYKGKKDSIQIKNISQVSSFVLRDLPEKYEYWYKSPSDSIEIEILSKDNKRKFKRKRKDKKDSLILKFVRKMNFSPLDTLKLTANIPLINLDSSKIIFKQDSIPIKFNSKQEKNYSYSFNFDKKPGKKYKIEILPQAVTDFLGNYNQDTLRTNLVIPPLEKFGNLNLEITGTNRDFFVELLDEKNRIIRKTPTQFKEGTLQIKYLPPGKYHIRIVWDKNRNNRWDTGNYLKHILPENVEEINKSIEIRANWDINQKIKL